MLPPTSAVQERLARAGPVVFGLYATVAAFSTYFCMYAFRKPFTVGTYPGRVELGALGALDVKILLVVSQVVGYTASKFLGIKFVSEMTPGRRATALLAMLGAAHAALLLFALVPAALRPLCMVLNGLPLGMVWGLTFGFLEGRQTSEALGAGLSASYILASGAVKSVGRWLLNLGMPEAWMPFATGALFVPPLLLFTWMLRTLPPPDEADRSARTERVPMDARARRAFFRRFAPGLVPLTVLYVVLTAYRDFRDNFAREIWDAVGYADSASIYALSEVPVALGVLAALGLLMLIRDNRRALLTIHLVMFLGVALVGGATLAFQAGWLAPAPWMVLIGLGLYLAYVPYGCMLFDRLIAAVGVAATAGFLIYVTDAFGYLGSVAVLFYRNLGQPQLSWLEFFVAFSYVTSATCGVLFVAAAAWFAWRTRGSAPRG